MDIWNILFIISDPYKIVGIGNNDTIYRFSLTSKNLAVSNFSSKKESLLDGLKGSSTDLHCVDVDPRNREWVIYNPIYYCNYCRLYSNNEIMYCSK